MKRVLDKPYEAGICPCCGSQIEYGQTNHMDNGGTIDWECPNCEASGEEGYDEVFDGMHYNVRDAEGNDCVYEPAITEKAWNLPCLYRISDSAVWEPVSDSSAPVLLFRGQTRRKGEKVWMDGIPVASNWVQGGAALGNGAFSIIYTYDPVDKYPVYTDTVCQYTGMDDMKNRNIFTNDILRVHVSAAGAEYSFTVLVKLVAGAFVCVLPEGEGYVLFQNWNYDHVQLEVIGNVFDDPEEYK